MLPSAAPVTHLPALIEEAWAHDPALAAAGYGVGAREAQVREVETWPAPRLQGGLFLMQMGPGLPQPNMPQLALSQAIPDPGKLGLAAAAAQKAAEQARDQARGLADGLARDVTAAYLDIAYADAALAENRVAVALGKEAMRAVLARYTVDQGTMADALRGEAEVSRLLDDRDGLQSTRTAAVARIDVLAGRPAQTPMGAVDPLSPVASDDRAWVGQAVDGIDRLERQSPELAAARASASAAGARLALAQREQGAPDYDVQLAAGIWSPGNVPYVSGMVGLTLPWLDSGRYARLVERSKEDAQAATARAQGTRNSVRGEAIALAARFDRAVQQGDRYRFGIVPQLAAAYRSALAAYQVGHTDFTTVLDAETSLYRAELREDRALVAAGKALCALRALVGAYPVPATTEVSHAP